MVIFSSRLPIYMHLASIPGIIVAMIKSTLHSITNVLRNIGDRCKDSKILWPIARVIKWAVSPKECRQAHCLQLRKPTKLLCRWRRSALLNKVLYICFVVLPIMDKTFVKALQLHATVRWIPWTPSRHVDVVSILIPENTFVWTAWCIGNASVKTPTSGSRRKNGIRQSNMSQERPIIDARQPSWNESERRHFIATTRINIWSSSITTEFPQDMIDWIRRNAS
jgi:hypothetical protein